MLTAEQIRIGNTVLYNDIIYNIWSIGNNSTPKRQSYYVDLDCEEKDIHLKGIDVDEIKPIELTEEWLLKMGFQANGKFYTINVFEKDERFDIDLKGWIGFNNMVAECNINTVHKLQNLYHALTGEELTIK